MEKDDFSTEPNSTTCVVKAVLGTDDKRIIVLGRPSFELLATKVAAVFGLAPGDFALRYFDDEKDLITLSTDEELQLAFTTVERGILRVQIDLLQPDQLVGVKRRRPVSSPCLEGVDREAIAYLVQHMSEKDVKVKPKKCAKFLRHAHGDIAQATSVLDAWCVGRAAKLARKREKRALKHKNKAAKHGELSASESAELEQKLELLETKGFTKRKKNVKLLYKCDLDVGKVIEVLHHKESKKVAKEEWRRLKKARKEHHKTHKYGYKHGKKCGKDAYKRYKKQHKKETKLLKRQQFAGFQELAAPASPMPVVG